MNGSREPGVLIDERLMVEKHLATALVDVGEKPRNVRRTRTHGRDYLLDVIELDVQPLLLIAVNGSESLLELDHPAAVITAHVFQLAVELFQKHAESRGRTNQPGRDFQSLPLTMRKPSAGGAAEMLELVQRRVKVLLQHGEGRVPLIRPEVLRELRFELGDIDTRALDLGEKLILEIGIERIPLTALPEKDLQRERTERTRGTRDGNP